MNYLKAWKLLYEKDVSFGIGALLGIASLVLSFAGILPFYSVTYQNTQLHHWIFGAVLLLTGFFLIPEKWEIRMPYITMIPSIDLRLVLKYLVIGFAVVLIADQLPNIINNNFSQPSLMDYVANFLSYSMPTVIKGSPIVIFPVSSAAT